MRAAPSRPPRSRSIHRVALAAVLISAFLAAVPAAAAAEICGASGAHAKHVALGFTCATCHPCAGLVAFGAFTFPGGTTSASGTVSRDGRTTCSLGCHSPFGATPWPVEWNAGALTCTQCHTNVATNPGPLGSSHAASAGVAGASCESCHDHSQHTGGQVRFFNAEGTTTSSNCVGCHSGLGETLGSQGPPLLVGWSDVVQGDFHGAREGTCRFDALDATGQKMSKNGGIPCPTGQPDHPGGLRITSRWWYQSGLSGPWVWTCDIETVDEAGNRIGEPLLRQPCPPGVVLNSSCNNPAGDPDCYPTTLVTRGFGGTLRSPYVRGQGALPCAACHDSHSSTNAFLLASQVNGTTITPGAIDRAGVGAQALCNACHQGDRHEVCLNCHKETWTTDGEYSWFEGAPVDPVPDGSPCFYCHGHEGLRRMKVATPTYPPFDHPFGLAGQNKAADECSHCHSNWKPPPLEYASPTVSPNPPLVSSVTATTATVSWQTNEPATTYVEYGVGGASHVAGDAAHVYQHSVTLTGLTPGATYSWRVRTSDAYRNVTTTPLQTFTTPQAQAVPRPDVLPVSAGATVGTHNLTVSLLWRPVTAPSGTAVEYEVQLASDSSFSYLTNGVLAGPGVTGSSVGDSGWVSGTPTTNAGQPALSYPAQLTNIPQDDCTDYVPNVYYWRARARDQQGNVSDWSTIGTFGVFAGDPWC